MPTELERVEIVAPGPLPGVGMQKDRIAANVQTATAADLARRQSLDLASHLNRTLGSVSLNELQGNPFQPDLNFRGFTASPLLGTSQGLSVYLDGVRLNQPFGDVVSWDLIPRAAIASITLMPGSNPLFGLNTLGGAIAVQTKDGLRNPGSAVQATAGSNRRASIEFETGGSRTDGWNWFVTGQRFHERGWRAVSPSDLSQVFAKFGTPLGTPSGAAAGETDLSITAAFTDNALTGNGLQEQGALQRDARSIYTAPDRTRNRSLFLSVAVTTRVSDALAISALGYVRNISTNTLNGDLNDEALGESVYQPNDAERGALASAGYTGYPSRGATAANTPFPR